MRKCEIGKNKHNEDSKSVCKAYVMKGNVELSKKYNSKIAFIE